MATLGNGVDFGDTTYTRVETYSAFGDPVRGIIGAGMSPSIVNTLDYINYGTTGNAIDFGDITQARAATAGFSNSNGGLG